MKTIFNNSMVAHVWAQQSQENGSNSTGSFYFHGKTIYSYGNHFPIARFIDTGKNTQVVLFNSDSYSVSTSNHQGYVAQALPFDAPVFTVPCIDLRITKKSEAKYIRDRYNDMHKENLAYLKKEMVDSLVSAKRARKESTITMHLNRADKFCTQYNRYLKAFKIKRKSLAVLNNAELRAILDKRDKARKKELIARKKREENLLFQNKRNIAKWLSGDVNQFPWDVSKVYLRINPSDPEMMETSKHASFPVSHALRAYKIMKRICSKKENFEPIRIGHFRITSMNKQCTITAGCHVIEWDVIEKMGEFLLSNEVKS